MVHNPGGDWHPGRGDNPSKNEENMFESFHPVIFSSEIPTLTLVFATIASGHPDPNMYLYRCLEKLLVM